MSTLGYRLDEYLCLKAELGYRLGAERTQLPKFVRFIEDRWPNQPITAAMALEWAGASPSAGIPGRFLRLIIARRFLIYLHAFLPEIQVPGPGLLVSPRRPNPYIYSSGEIGRMLRAASRLTPRGSIRPAAYATLIGLMASTGLRIGEVMRLQIEDLRLSDEYPHVQVCLSKFRKSRLVPLHSTAAAALRVYLRRRLRLGKSGPAFVSTRGQALTRHTVRNTFRTVWRWARIARPTEGRRPTIHSLRHTFAVSRLLVWQQEGADVGAMLHHLSVYMGHVEPKSTYWYLSATPELLSLAANSFERFAVHGGAQ